MRRHFRSPPKSPSPATTTSTPEKMPKTPPLPSPPLVAITPSPPPPPPPQLPHVSTAVPPRSSPGNFFFPKEHLLNRYESDLIMTARLRESDLLSEGMLRWMAAYLRLQEYELGERPGPMLPEDVAALEMAAGQPRCLQPLRTRRRRSEDGKEEDVVSAHKRHCAELLRLPRPSRSRSTTESPDHRDSRRSMSAEERSLRTPAKRSQPTPPSPPAPSPPHPREPRTTIRLAPQPAAAEAPTPAPTAKVSYADLARQYEYLVKKPAASTSAPISSAAFVPPQATFAAIAREAATITTRPVGPPAPAATAAAAAKPAAAPTNTAAAAAQPGKAGPRYPPLVVERLPNWAAHFKKLAEELGRAPSARPYGTGVRFTPVDGDEYRAVQRYLTKLQETAEISWFSYTLPADRPLKVGIRGLPINTEPADVIAALAEHGFEAEFVKCIRARAGRPGCIHFAQMRRTPNISGVYQIQELLCMPGIKIEAWRGKKGPAQCHRCQTFRHSSHGCHRPLACVRCGGPHAAQDCPRPREDLPTCANCAGPHPANFTSCPVFRKELRNRKAGTVARTVPTSTARPPPARPNTVQESAPATLMAPANLPTSRGDAVKKPSRRRKKRKGTPAPGPASVAAPPRPATAAAAPITSLSQGELLQALGLIQQLLASAGAAATTTASVPQATPTPRA